MTHTPGPWRIEKPADELVHFGRHVIGSRPAISIWADSEGKDQNLYHEIALVADNDLDNARLIAAAPDLLAALQAIVRDFDEMKLGVLKLGVHSILDARAALAKVQP